MSLQPILEGTTIRLRPLVEADRTALTAAGSDPAIWAQHPDYRRYEKAHFNRFFDDALASGGALAIEERATGRVIGTSRYQGLDLEAGQIEVGWTFLVRDHWGGTTNREVKALMLHHAFEQVPRVLFRVGADNWRSRRAIEKIGARLVENFDTSKIKSVVYEIDREAFETNAP